MWARQWLLVVLLMAPPWGAFLLAVYWLLEPEPIVMVYQHAHFLSRPAANRAQALEFEIADDIVTPSQQIYIYREYCQRTASLSGETVSEWDAVDSSFVWPAAQRPLPDLGPGCHVWSSGLVAPNSIDRRYHYVPKWRMWINPLREVTQTFDPIPLEIRR